MWNDLNMHDRHKLIRLAVTNGVYDLDTIRSLYNNNEYKDGGNMRIASYKDNDSYPDRKLYRNVKRDFRKDPEAEYKDYEDYGVRVYNPSLSSDAPNRKERQEAMLERIKQDFPEIQKNDVKKTAFKSNNIGWGNSIIDNDRRTLYGLQQNYDFVNNIVPYAKLGMETPESIQRREELERRNRNTTFDYTNNFDIGGDLPTDPNRPIIDTQPIIDKIRANNLVKYAMRDSALQQIQDLTNRMYEEEIKRRTMEWLNPSNYTDKGDMVNALRVPVAEARPTFINTYKDGGEKNRWGNYINSSNSEITESGNYTPEDWLRINYPDKYKQIQELHAIPAKPEQNRFEPYIVQTPKYREDIEKAAYDFGYTPYGVFLPEIEVNANASEFRPEGGYSQYYQNYKNALDDLKLRQDIARTSEEGIELTPLYQDPIFNSLFLGAGLINSGAVNAGLKFIANPATTTLKVAQKVFPGINNIGRLKNIAALTDAAYTTKGVYDAIFSDEGIKKTYNHIKEGNAFDAIKSGIGDALNLIPIGMSYKYSKPLKTLINDLKYQGNYFKSHWGEMNPIEIGYNIIRPSIRFGTRASGLNEYLNLPLYNAMIINKGDPVGSRFLSEYKDMNLKDLLTFDAGKEIGDFHNLGRTYGQQVLANTKIGQFHIPENRRMVKLTSDEVKLAKTNPVLKKGLFKNVPMYKMKGKPKAFTEWAVNQPNDHDFGWTSYNQDSEGPFWDMLMRNDNLGGHWERLKDGRAEIFDIQHYTPFSNKDNYTAKWLNPIKNIKINNKNYNWNNFKKDITLSLLDVLGDNYGLYTAFTKNNFIK